MTDRLSLVVLRLLSASSVLSGSIGGNQGTNTLLGAVVDLGCLELRPQRHNYTHQQLVPDWYYSRLGSALGVLWFSVDWCYQGGCFLRHLIAPQLLGFGRLLVGRGRGILERVRIMGHSKAPRGAIVSASPSIGGQKPP